MATVADVQAFLRRFAPLDLAEEWDNVGLLLGESARKVRKVMTCLTVTPASAAEAVEDGAQLIVSHHPVLFRPTQRITSDSPEGRMLLALLKAGIAVYSPHTSFDNTQGGINDILCRRLELEQVQPLRGRAASSSCKLVVFVPDTDLGKVSDALFGAGAGLIGQYSQCSFRVAGTGTFFGSEQSHPTVGKKGRREEAPEWRLEVVCPQERVAEAIRALRGAHSYEEPAFDVYPLQALPGKGGAGRLGRLAAAEPLEDFARRVRQALKAAQVQVIGSSRLPVRRVAVACGAGGEFLRDCSQARADVFLTGELRFHDQLAAQARDLAVVLPGHYATERPGVEELAVILGREFPSLQVWPSHQEAEPVWTQ
jgi:dinuclear metal center YbgI/SA1388 family protein